MCENSSTKKCESQEHLEKPIKFFFQFQLNTVFTPSAVKKSVLRCQIWSRNRSRIKIDRFRDTIVKMTDLSVLPTCLATLLAGVGGPMDSEGPGSTPNPTSGVDVTIPSCCRP
jgi:hypothetical protein